MRSHCPWVIVATLIIVAARAAGGAAGPYYEKPRMGDALTFWGWSADGRQFAYETWTNGGGEPLDCHDEAVLTIYDAVKDRATMGGVVRSTSVGNSDRCTNPDVRATMNRDRAAHLRRHHVTERFAGPLRFQVASGGGSGTLALSGTTVLQARLSIRDGNRRDVMANSSRPGMSYRLSVVVGAGQKRVIAEGPRRGALSLSLDGALVFVGPTEHFAALCLPVNYSVYHGTWTHWDCHSVPLAE